MFAAGIEYQPPINADERGLKTTSLSYPRLPAFIGDY